MKALVRRNFNFKSGIFTIFKLHINVHIVLQYVLSFKEIKIAALHLEVIIIKDYNQSNI